MSHTIPESESGSASQIQATISQTHDDSLPRELLDHVDCLRVILPVISVSVMALNRRDAESDSDIAFVLSQHVCDPLDREIERVESLLAAHISRQQQQESHA